MPATTLKKSNLPTKPFNLLGFSSCLFSFIISPFYIYLQKHRCPKQLDDVQSLHFLTG